MSFFKWDEITMGKYYRVYALLCLNAGGIHCSTCTCWTYLNRLTCALLLSITIYYFNSVFTGSFISKQLASNGHLGNSQTDKSYKSKHFTQYVIIGYSVLTLTHNAHCVWNIMLSCSPSNCSHKAWLYGNSKTCAMKTLFYHSLHTAFTS